MANRVAQRPNPVPLGLSQAAAKEGHDFTGEIRRADAEGTAITGFLIDKLGFRITLRGTKDPRAGHGYMLFGEVTHIPERLRVAAIDDPAGQ